MTCNVTLDAPQSEAVASALPTHEQWDRCAERTATLELIALLNDPEHAHDLVQCITRFLQGWTGCQAVGIRLREGDDFPYFETRGLRQEFVRAENRICECDADGQPVLDELGRPSLGCMCGAVLSGLFDPTQPFFTPKGSFWTNSTTALLASMSESDRQARTRGRCNAEGFESVGLFRIGRGRETFGLLQVNDRACGFFTRDALEFLENAADQIGIAVERLRDQQALRDSEEQYRALFTNMLEGFAHCQMLFENGVPTDFIFLDVNTRFKELTGIGDAVGKRVSEVIPGFRDANREFLEFCARVARTGQPDKIETYMPGLDTWFSIAAYCPRPAHFIATFDVITERKRAEAALQFQNILLTTQQEASIDGILVVDEQDHILSHNQRFVDMWGIPPPLIADRRDRPILEFKMAQMADPAVFLQRVQSIYDHKDVSVHDELVLRDGRVVDRHSAPMFDPDGRYLGRTWYFRDITERKHAEESLRASRQLVEDIINAIPVRVFWKDRDLVYMGCNTAFAHDAGFDGPSDIIGKTDYQMGWQAQADLYREDDRQVIESGRPKLLVEEPQTTPEGSSLTLLTSKMPLCNAAGGIVGVLGTYMDITERKQAELKREALEKQLLAAQKMEAIGALASGIAHEINTPTQYIGDNVQFLTGACEAMDEALAASERLLAAVRADNVTPAAVAEAEKAITGADLPFLREEVPSAIAQAEEGVQRVTAIVRAMKEFAHPGPVHKEPADLNKAIESTVTVCRNEWKYVAELILDLDPALPLVPCLAGEVKQVVLNLVVNAAHAIGDIDGGGGEKGRITIKTRRDGADVVLQVVDTGAGIPDAVRDRIFDPFFTTKAEGKGSGQGLAIAHNVIVKKHGGSISFESELGRGTEFTVRLPLELLAEPATGDRLDPAPAGG